MINHKETLQDLHNTLHSLQADPQGNGKYTPVDKVKTLGRKQLDAQDKFLDTLNR